MANGKKLGFIPTTAEVCRYDQKGNLYEEGNTPRLSTLGSQLIILFKLTDSQSQTLTAI